MNNLYDFEIEPEVRTWLEGLSDHDFKRVDEVAGILAALGPELGVPGPTTSKGRSGSSGSEMWRLE
ncbi:hypothetical protein [Streptomyces sp. NPDC015350]|uniref:hypothetical protein n=1 Tax=Streptomyces sp. NPDC015350 TaxID=3364955 RepID=UPI0036F61174